MKSKAENIKNGFTMVELIVTIVILAFGIMGIYGFFHPASILTGNFPLRVTADYLAQEGLEIVKNIRDNNIINNLEWSNGLSLCSSGCQLDYKTGTDVETPANTLKPYTGQPLNLNSDGFYSYDQGSASKFTRKITITQPAVCSGEPEICYFLDNVLKVNVLVSWDYNNKPFSFETIGYIYNLF